MTRCRRASFLLADRLRPSASALALVAALGAAACAGDTLYDADGPVLPDVPGPSVAVVDPLDGQDVQAGRVVNVRIAASDSLGVALVELQYRGVASGTLRIPIVPARTSVVVDTAVALPAGSVGTLELIASSRNGLGGVGRAEVVRLRVAATDTVVPTASIEAVTPSRMELLDSLSVRVTARDNAGGSGLVRVGVTVLVAVAGRADTVALQRVFNYPAPRRGTVTEEVRLAVPVTAAELPRALTLRYHAFAVDSAGNCGAAVAAVEQRLGCSTFGQATIAAAAAPEVATLVVAGRSLALPATGSIADAVVDAARRRLYLSNLDRSRVEVLDLQTLRFGSPVAVGAGPWGMALNRTADTLIVANSGGTNLSYVSLAGTPAEVLPRRLQTPNTVVFEVAVSEDAGGFQRLTATFTDFSDRPQFVAQDAAGRLLFSTRPTPARRDGTIRVAEMQPGWQAPEVRLLVGDLVSTPDSTRVTILNVDSVRVFTSPGTNDVIEIYDHVSGFPGQIVRSGMLPLYEALEAMLDTGQSDMRWTHGRFSLDLVGLRDTTFVAASGNRGRIAFGEGARPAGRIIMWNSATASISNEITVADLVGNASERVLGLDLNADGSFNVARGEQAAYFFRQDLRLQGLVLSAAPTPAGAQLHPGHPAGPGLPPSGSTTLSFVAAGDVIRIFDTVHFVERGEIPIRDPIAGPLRVSTPLGDAGPCPGPDCVVARLYGVTRAGAVVLVDVRTRDIGQP